ncbi:hypothetical protein [Kibdelosporangium aridum]|uniref:hypothetical protein n=1 Tax=Kibdelosporangium aridum TaxID=2030 RepID=UPI0035F0E8A8
MGRHRFDKHDGDNWGGPDLIVDGSRPTTHSNSNRAPDPTPADNTSAQPPQGNT